MLKEYPEVSQVEGEPKRRWFYDDYFDLIVWLDNSGDISGFQLCYDKSGYFRALTWYEGKGYTHNSIDEGESSFRPKQSPILVADGLFSIGEIAEKFKLASPDLDPDLAGFIYKKVLEYKNG